MTYSYNGYDALLSDVQSDFGADSAGMVLDILEEAASTDGPWYTRSKHLADRFGKSAKQVGVVLGRAAKYVPEIEWARSKSTTWRPDAVFESETVPPDEFQKALETVYREAREA